MQTKIRRPINLILSLILILMFISMPFNIRANQNCRISTTYEDDLVIKLRHIGVGQFVLQLELDGDEEWLNSCDNTDGFDTVCLLYGTIGSEQIFSPRFATLFLSIPDNYSSYIKIHLRTTSFNGIPHKGSVKVKLITDNYQSPDHYDGDEYYEFSCD